MTGCEIWPGYVDRHGYGRTREARLAHRVAWESANGPIPTGMTVDHLCYVTRCVNAEHLRLLTPSENSQNQRSAARTHCTNGHEFTAENTYYRIKRTNTTGRRDCRACINDRQKRYQARKAA